MVKIEHTSEKMTTIALFNVYLHRKVIIIPNQSFCDLNQLIGEGTNSKVKLKDGSRSSNWGIQTSKMKKEDHQISTTSHFQ